MTANLETRITDFVAGAAPWLAPIPTAFVVTRAAVDFLSWPWPVALIAGATVETIGLAATNTALTLWDYNRSRRKSDPAAPAKMAAALVVGYVAVAVALTVALDLAPGLRPIAPVIFPFLSLVGVTLVGLRSDHRRRLAAIAQDKAERKADRQAARAAAAAQPAQASAQRRPKVALVQRPNPKREAAIGALLEVYRANPYAGATEAAQAIGAHRNSIYNYLGELETAGRIRKNGHGVEVLE